ncbi:SDR family oxidoreductase [Adhaeretor mobilis]|uniref:NAD dependent epimerase/dehydratase family protein n=1 Tax=Adhaeretor mobilis TaxID=1930276 RepID=A0A517N207_9BACT|nr:SDR family oxidoreductase [Adhaeretor mobilis]QDT01176.1 NAD dependent epimerase/dehydratase family protein [Adhaeretor mobilis]
MDRLVFGCGYLGERVAAQWRESGDTVHVVTRSMESAVAYREYGYETIVADVTDPNTFGELPEVDTVLYAVGYDRTSDHSIEEVYAQGVSNVLAALPESVEHFIYISTTGVYGDANGKVVDETTPTSPHRAGGKASLAAERFLTESLLESAPQSRQAAILRLAGIYGPGRVPYLEKLRAGEPIAALSEGWLNLTHVDDAARVVVQVDRWLDGGAWNAEDRAVKAIRPVIFNVSDGSPVVRGDYYREVARLIGAAEPQFEQPEPDSPKAARAATNKRISNAKLLEELEIKFQYPSYREGLKAILG